MRKKSNARHAHGGDDDVDDDDDDDDGLAASPHRQPRRSFALAKRLAGHLNAPQPV